MFISICFYQTVYLVFEPLVISVLWPSREGNHITNILHSSDKHDQTLKTQSKSTVRYRSITSEIQVPFQRLFVHSQLLNSTYQPFITRLPLFQQIQILFSLRSSNQFTNLGYQDIHCTHSLSIFIQLHVESLDLLGIVSHDHRTLVHLLSQVSLMF